MKFKILYVDDEIENLRSFYAVFRREYEVHTTPNPQEALELLKNEDFHLVLTDQRMPIMSGFEFLKELMQICPTKPPNRMMVSGYSQADEVRLSFEKYGLFDFISKPWNESFLRKRIEEAIQDCLHRVD